MPEPMVSINLRSVYAGPKGTFQPGSVITVPAAEAKQLIDGFHAEPLKNPQPAPEVRGGSKSEAEAVSPEADDESEPPIETAEADRQAGRRKGGKR